MSPPHFRFYDEAPVFRNNLYWSTESGAQSASIFPDERNWVEWQASGNDTGSLWSQPLFRDPAMKDYSLAANSPAWAIGFEEIDVAAIGPGGDVTST